MLEARWLLLSCLLAGVALASDRPDPEKLERRFAEATDLQEKYMYANVLFMCGAAKRIHFDFVVGEAEAALAREEPCPLAYDEEGRAIRGELSDEFTAWAAKTGREDLEEAARDAIWNGLMALQVLSTSGSPKTVDILLRALTSSNCILRSAAVDGLARLEVTGAVPLIVELAEVAPAEEREGLGMHLLHFDVPAAREAARRFLGEERFEELLPHVEKERMRRRPVGPIPGYCLQPD